MHDQTTVKMGKTRLGIAQGSRAPPNYPPRKTMNRKKKLFLFGCSLDRKLNHVDPGRSGCIYHDPNMVMSPKKKLFHWAVKRPRP